jgi:hypothetical protein
VKLFRGSAISCGVMGFDLNPAKVKYIQYFTQTLLKICEPVDRRQKIKNQSKVPVLHDYDSNPAEIENI